MYGLINIMEPSVSSSGYRALNRWNNNHVFAGPVGSVGDPLQRIRYKHSNPDMPIRWAGWTNGKAGQRLGAYVQDGDDPNYHGYRQLRTKKQFFKSYRGFENDFGFIHQDIRASDTYVEPEVAPLEQLTWRNKVAKVYKALIPGEQFLPIPGSFELKAGELPRGGSLPTVIGVEGVTDSIGGSVVAPYKVNMGTFVNNYPEPVLPQGYGGNPTRAGVSNLGIQSLTKTPDEDKKMRRMR